MPSDVSQAVRFHLSVNVSDLEKSVRFFEALLGEKPAKQRVDYAKFEIDEPPLVLSLEPHPPGGRGALNHAGFRFPNSEALVAAQRRLEIAGFQTEREEGVECCYSKQTKFWVNDPDGGLWEFYILEEDIAHRGAGQSAENLLPQVANCGPACGPARPEGGSFEHRMGSPLTLQTAAAESMAEIRLRGTFNLPEHAHHLPEILDAAHRALVPGGQLQVHVLTTNQPVAEGELTLPGPAAAVKHVPLDRELFHAIETVGFTAITLATYRSAPCFRIGEADLRETLVVCRKSSRSTCQDDRFVVYKGPFVEIRDDEGHVFRRGEPTPVCNATWEAIQRSPNAGQFVSLAAPTVAVTACTGS